MWCDVRLCLATACACVVCVQKKQKHKGTRFFFLRVFRFRLPASRRYHLSPMSSKSRYKVAEEGGCDLKMCRAMIAGANGQCRRCRDVACAVLMLPALVSCACAVVLLPALDV